MIANNFKQQIIDPLSTASEQLPLNQISQQKQTKRGRASFGYCQSSNNQDLVSISQAQLSEDEVAASKRQSPIKFSSQLFKSCDSGKGRTSLGYKGRYSKESSEIAAQNIGQEQNISCLHNLLTNEQVCRICKGAGFLQENNNLVKFFKYLIEFKLGKKSSYETKRSDSKKNEANSYSNDFYNQKELKATLKNPPKNFCYRINERTSQKPIPNIKSSYYNKVRCSEGDKMAINTSQRFSVRSTIISRKEQIVEEINSIIMIHQNYQCDDCLCSPIIGTRYHCSTCEDFDQCQKCHHQSPHLHLMEKIDKTGKAKQLENMLTFFASPVRMSSALRPPTDIKLTSDYISVARRAMT